MALDSGADQGDIGRGSPASRPQRFMASPLTAAVRWAVIGPPSSIAIGTPVAGSLRTTTAWMPGRPSSVFVA